ncbi:MAG: alkaline phosphatase [bacterium]|nr:alkaline phosphatase [bacterium]
MSIYQHKQICTITLKLSLLLIIASSTAFAAKNVIVMIADGWGFNTVLASNYYNGVTSQSYQKFPVTLAMSHYSAGTMKKLYAEEEPPNQQVYNPKLVWSVWEWVMKRATDSAAAATAISTGVKTRNQRLGVDSDGRRIANLAERAKKTGKSIGVVSSVEFSHATPAGFLIHNTHRKNYREIAQAMIDSSNADVIIGCGHPLYDDNGNPIPEANLTDKSYEWVGGKEQWLNIVSGKAGGTSPFTFVETVAQFQEIAHGEEVPKRLLGIPRVHETLQCRRTPHPKGNDTVTQPYSQPRNRDVPSLALLSVASLQTLRQNRNGFFVMIEGGAIDWAGHDNWQARLIEEMDEFNAAVDSVVRWIETNSSWDETLLIVTGDHETGYLWGPGSGANSQPMWQPLIDNGKGKLPGMWFCSDSHVNSVIPFYAKGAEAFRFNELAKYTDPVWGKYLDNTDIFHVCNTLLAETR